MDNNPGFTPIRPSPTTPPLIQRRNRQHRRAEVVTVTSFADTSTAASTASARNNVPVGPIVGGIIGGVAVVLLIGGIWWWCHHKAEKERKERQARLRAKASKSTGALSARPSIVPKDSTASIHSMDNLSHTRPNGSAGKHSAFNVAGAAVPSVGYDSRGAGREVEKPGPAYTSKPTSGRNGSDRLAASTTPVNTSSSSSSSGSDPDASSPSSRRHRHQRSLSKEPITLAPVVQPGINRYQPARPSPLALAAKSADGPVSQARGSSLTSPTSSDGRSREGSLSGSAVFGVKAEERKPDEGVPKWGAKPFRTAVSASSPNREAFPEDTNAVEQVTDGVYQPNEDSEDDDPFEHAKYDRHRSTASTHVSSVAGGNIGKRDTVRQSRDRDVMGGIAEWQGDVAGGAYAPDSPGRREGYAGEGHQRGPSYPYPPPQQAYTSHQYHDAKATSAGDPFSGGYEGAAHGNEYHGSART